MNKRIIHSNNIKAIKTTTTTKIKHKKIRQKNVHSEYFKLKQGISRAQKRHNGRYIYTRSSMRE